MTKFNFSIFLFIFFVFISCQKKQVHNKGEKNEGEIVDIWVVDSLENRVDQLLLSDVAQDIEIIPLQFDKNHSFSFTDNMVAGDNDFFLNTRKMVLHYDKKGKFLNQIGKRGEGPEDISSSNGIGIDDKNHLIYVAHGLGLENEIKTYNYQGEFIKSTRIAERGAHMYGTVHQETRNYTFYNNQHVLRRLLPTSDNSKDIWQIQVQDTSGTILATFYDPVIMNYIDKNHEGKLENAPSNQWFAFSPILNRYLDNINFMFDSNDTIYQYLETKKALKPRYILHCGERPTFKDIRTLNKEPEYFKYTFITDILESKDFLYLVAEKDRFAYLLRVDKKTGATHTIRQEGEIIISPIMKVRHRKITVPGFTNDLCGGLPFFPNSQDNKQWIAAFDAPDLLEKIDIEQLKKSDVLLPEKRDQLVRILENLNEDDDPVIMIVTLK